MTKKRILFVGEGVTLSHIIRPLFLAKTLSPENHDIAFACDKRYRPIIEKAEIAWHPLASMSPDEFNKKLSTGDPLYTYDRLKNYIEDELKLFSEINPDIVVGDFRISLGISSPIAKIPYACLVNAYWSPFTTQKKFLCPELQITKTLGLKIVTPIFQAFSPLISFLHCKDFNRISSQYHLPKVESPREMYSQGTWTLYPDTPGLAPTANLPKTHRYLGPICELFNMPQPEWWGKWPEDKPVIYLSMGSSGEISSLSLIKDVLKEMEVSVIFSTSGRINTNNLPKNFFATDYVSGLAVAKIAQLFITNGGCGSAYQALSYGVPVLGFPSNMDQFFTMQRLDSMGAGKFIRPSLANKNLISHFIHEMLTNSSYRASAQNFANEIRQFDPANIFKSLLDEFFVNNKQKGTE